MTVELLFDIETDGLLRQLSRLHCLGIKDLNTGEKFRFRRNAVEDTIEDGLNMLAEADLLVGHNIVPFDLRAITKVYPWWQPKEGQKWRDTLVMSQLIFSDQREKDFKLWKKGKLPGGMIGKHGLEAWGHRSGTVLKGDYAKAMKAKGLDPWAEWSPEMEDYMMDDLEVNEYLWNKLCETIAEEDYPEEPIILEHEVQDYLTEQEINGICFDVERAQALQEEWQEYIDQLSSAATEHYGSWWAPAKKRIVAPLWDDPGGKWREKAKSLPKPRPELGEDSSRKVWAEVVIPSKTINYKNKPGRTEGAAFCPVELKTFNPQSREQIVDRFVTVYDWEPNPEEDSEWTDGGAPAVGDKILRALTHIPMAEELAEIFYYKKRLGMLADGKNAWLKKVTDQGLIHHRCNGGGTVSGRASHSDPNLGQTPKVKSGKVDKRQLDFAVQVIGNERVWSLVKKADDETWSGPLVGRKGKHGWECRDLFYVPAGWKLVGCDLSGIEYRCLANMTYAYEAANKLEHLIDVVLNGDIHTVNQKAAGLSTRDQAKTFIYGFMYGAGDVKLGSIVNPSASVLEQRKIGGVLRSTFMARMPALAKAIKQIQKEARRKGYIIGLDGRHLRVRSPHSALNLKLQSDAALIAKKWLMLTFEELIYERGWQPGWQGDFVPLLWVHDELQIAVRDEDDMPAELAALLVGMAAEAGRYFDFACPVDAEAKIGTRWSETH